MIRLARIFFTSLLVLSPTLASAQEALGLESAAMPIADLSPLSTAMAAGVRTASALELPAADLVLPTAAMTDFATFAEPISRTTLGPASTSPPFWVTALAVAGPLADGFSTYYALKQNGPRARVMEGNGFYHHLFGSNVKASEILAFKVGQAALFGWMTHNTGKIDRERAIGMAILQAGVHFAVSGFNLRNGMRANRLNAARAR